MELVCWLMQLLLQCDIQRVYDFPYSLYMEAQESDSLTRRLRKIFDSDMPSL